MADVTGCYWNLQQHNKIYIIPVQFVVMRNITRSGTAIKFDVDLL